MADSAAAPKTAAFGLLLVFAKNLGFHQEHKIHPNYPNVSGFLQLAAGRV